MLKKVLAILLCLAMVMSFVPVAYAAEEQSVTLSGDDALNSDFVHYEKEPQVNRPAAPFGDGSKLELPDPKECSCDAGDAVLTHHADNCLRKCYYKDLCALDYESIFVLWREVPDDVREYMLRCLEEYHPGKLQEMEEMWARAEDGEADLTGTASLTVDSNTVTTEGVPVGSQLTVEGASDAMQAVVDNVAAENSKLQDAVFSYDISVQDADGEEWQPENDYVDVRLELGELNLPKWTRLVIVHVDDEGNSSLINAMVGEDGSIEFQTQGFSTFAGFTVDFEYGAFFHSISGYSDILLSELFNELQMPLDAKNVTNVTFTDYSLIAVDQVEGDWLLTSLKPFTTYELLTITMADGSVYPINVTDAYEIGGGNKTPDISIDGTFYDQPASDDNQVVSWYGTNGGNCYTNYASAGTSNPADGHSKSSTIYISGAGTFRINLLDRKASGDDNETRVNYDIKGIEILNGAHVRVVVVDKDSKNTDAFKSNRATAAIRATAGQNTTLFNVKNGSLSLEGRAAVTLVLNGHQGNGYSQPLVTLGEKCTGFSAIHCKFENTTGGAVNSKANKCTSFVMENCYVGASVTANGRGAGVYIEEAATANKYSQVKDLTIKNTQFIESKSKGMGGAVALFGKVYNAKIEGCTFTNNGDVNNTNGGAIAVGASVGLLDITGCTFTNCQTKGDGGAIWVRTMNMDSVDVSDATTGYKGSYSRVNKLNISGCTFESCKTLMDTDNATEDDSSGGAVALHGEIAQVIINDCDFTNCEVTGNTLNTGGGAISLGYYNLPENFEDVDNGGQYYWTSKMVWDDNDYNGDGINNGSDADLKDDLNGDGVVDTNDEYGCKRRGKTYVWTSTETDGTVTNTERTTMGSVTISGGCTFTNCTGGYVGGGILVKTGTCVQSLSVSDAVFDGCKTGCQGSMILFNNCIVDTATITGCTFKNGNFLTGYTLSAEGGTLRTVGNTTVNMKVSDCEFIDNVSISSGGGIFWNAANLRVSPNSGEKKIDVRIAIENCTFTGNQATNGHGGGVFCEALMTVTGCTFENNTASNLGGGIAMGVYANDARMMQDNEMTQLKLDPKTEIKNNEAKNGGGVALRANATPAINDEDNYAHTVQFQLNGASIHDNTATECGGGVYFLAVTYDDSAKQAEVDRFEKLITIDNGKIYSNHAKNGGGIGMESRENTTIQISEGEIYGNTAKRAGGGVYLSGLNAECSITGGTIGGSTEKANLATWGGGIAITGGASIRMTPGKDTEGNDTLGTISYNSVSNRTTGTNSASNYPQGGGVWLDHGTAQVYNSITIEDGVIDHNTTPGGSSANGGGVFVGQYDTCTITGGSITYNSTNTAWGGGIFVYQHGFAEVSGGTISNNHAGAGGAICLQNTNATIHVSDGTISNNTAVDTGGAVYACYSSYIKITGGQITGNTTQVTTNAYGGALALYSATADIYGGEISGNGSTNGGGISARSGAVITMHGGTIQSNEAVDGGGVYAIDAGSKVSIHSGQISSNTASNNGGGVYVNAATLVIDKGEDAEAGGTVSENTAANGGGVYVVNGGDLTIDEGFLIKNSAVGRPSSATTAKSDVAYLKGTGGGVFIANGKSDSDPSTFTLQGENIAIYENLAAFAADDVYANGTYTKLNVPLVIDMNLAGYGSKAEGWFEDYATNDSAYSSGLQQGNASNVKRYRDTTNDLAARAEIGTNSSGLLANTKNVYVCMTLGMTGAVADVIVFDYGIPADIDVMGNDITIKPDNSIIAGISFSAPTLDTGKTYSSQLSAGFVKVLNDPSGRFTVKANGSKVLFMLLNMDLNQPITVYYAVEYKVGNTARYYYSTLTIIPATSIYYEDNFVEFSKGGEEAETADNLIPVMVHVPSDWTEVCLHAWYKENGKDVAITQWPGNLMQKTENADWYIAYVPDHCTGLIVNNNNNGKQTVDITVAQGQPGIWLDVSVNMESGKYCVHSLTYDNALPTPPASANANLVPVIIKVPNSWSDVKLHSWVPNGEGTTWPGESMTSLGYGWYYGYVKSNRTGLVVNNNGSAQSEDITVDLSGAPNGTWFVLSESTSNGKHPVVSKVTDPTLPDVPETYTIHVKLPSGWNGGYVWAWGVTDASQKFPGEALTAEGNGWHKAEIPTFAKSYLFAKSTDTNVDQSADILGTGSEQWVVMDGTKVDGKLTVKEYNFAPDSYPTVDGWIREGVTSDATQDGKRPGVNPDDVYGFENSYTGMTTYSYGSAMKTTVSQGNYASVKFSFWGTGFDVISMTSNETGTIVVKVTDAEGNYISNYLVDTYYGYTYNNGKWEVNNKAANALYQIPVIKVDLNSVKDTNDKAYGYGYYNVEIVASYGALFDHLKDGSYDFYLDAIRVYNPVGDNSADDAYIADNEYKPVYQKIRDKLISAGSFGSLTVDETITGAVYIDGTAGGNVADYTTYGPNNEVYLQNGQAIVFGLQGENLGSAQIGLKSNGSARVTIYGLDEDGVKTVAIENKEINTATELYYAITSMIGKTVVIKNTGSGILSLTNLKTTAAVAGSTDVDGGEMVIGLSGVNMALASLEGEKDPIVSEGVIAPQSATLTYEDEILLNIYFTMEGIEASELGLMTYTADGSTLLDTIPGAVFADGQYMATTRPIAAKNLGDTVYFRVYAKLADGSYVYSKLLSYSPKTYAMNILNNSDDVAMKSLVVAMLNYGAEAQKYFGYKTEALVNADLNAEQKALVADYSADMIAPLGKVDSAKVGAFVANGGFGKKYPTVSLEGAFAINYYFENSYAMNNGMTLYYWTAEDYAKAEVLTAENATGIVNGTTVSGIAAKDLDSTIYVAAVYECNGTSYCTGVLPYSIGAFCVSNGSALAQAIAVYGNYAQAYFG